MNTPFIYKCPKCSQPLGLVNENPPFNFRCDNNHCFDVAKEGYVNLHLVEKKKSKNPGDELEMMKSRRAFLNAGYYQAFADVISEMVLAIQPADKKLLDIGCGEGYYLEQIAKRNGGIQCAGVDLSKHGIRFAAKRKMGMQLSVASAYDLPFFDSQFDVVLSVFSPLCPVEAQRVLKSGAVLLMVGPGANHLRQLVEMIYDCPQAHKGNFDVLQQSDEFTLQDSETFTISQEVKGAALRDLLRMTPYYWQATAEQQQRIAELPSLSLDLQFELNTYKLTKS